MEIRWGMIGCGAVTEVKSGPGFQKAEGSRLVAVMRRNGRLAEDYAKRHGVSKWYDDAMMLIQDSEVDAVYIATPPGSHKEYTLLAAAAGKPVYVEKPMARNHVECLEMIEACEKAGVPLYVAYYRRALPKFNKVKQLIDCGAIGDVRFVTTTQYRPASADERDAKNPPWRVQPDIAGGGLFFDLASHTLDVQDFLLGPIGEAKGFAANQGGLYAAEDIVTGTYTFASGAHGMGTWCFTGPDYVDVNEIVGTNATLRFSTFGTEPIQFVKGTFVESIRYEHPKHIQQPLIQSIVNELRGSGKCPSTGKTAARTNWVMDQLVGEYYFSDKGIAGT